MKTFFACVLIAGVVLGTPALAKSSSASPLIGSWSVDTSRLPMSPAARPKRVTITFSQPNKARMTMDVDIISATGHEIHSVNTVALNGSLQHVKGSPEADIAAMKMPQSEVLVLALGKDGHGASTRIYTVNADGKHMIETASYFSHGGLPTLRTHYFSRIR